jgi:AcrR family transcriptional regulator
MPRSQIRPSAARLPVSARGKQTREELLVAARAVFEAQGFFRARTEDITVAAGFASGTFYTYFSSKLQIFQEVSEGVMKDMLRTTRPVLVRQAEPEGAAERAAQGIERANRKYFKAFARNAAFMRVLDEVEFHRDAGPASVRADRSSVYIGRAEESIRQLQASGLADPDLDVLYTATALTAMMSRLSHRVLAVDAADDNLDRITAVATLIWIRALGIPLPRPTGAAD